MLCTLGRDSHPLVFHAAFSGTFPAHTGKTPSLAREGARRFSQTLPLAASEGASQLSTLRACGGAVSVGGPGVAPGSVLRPTCRHSNRVGPPLPQAHRAPAGPTAPARRPPRWHHAGGRAVHRPPRRPLVLSGAWLPLYLLS